LFQTLPWQDVGQRLWSRQLGDALIARAQKQQLLCSS